MSLPMTNPALIELLKAVGPLHPKVRAMVMSRIVQTTNNITDTERKYRGILRNVPCDCYLTKNTNDWCDHMALSYSLFEGDRR